VSRAAKFSNPRAEDADGRDTPGHDEVY